MATLSFLLRIPGEVDFGTGTGRKAFLENFQPDSGPPRTFASTATKGKFIGTGHFFPRGMAFLEKGEGLILVYVFLFPALLANGC